MIEVCIGLLILIVLFKIFKPKPKAVQISKGKPTQEEYDTIKSMLDDVIIMLDDIQERSG